MNLEVCPQKSRMAPASAPHHSSRHHHDNGGCPFALGTASLLPPRSSQSILNRSRSFIVHPKKSRRRKNRLVRRSMQKKAQPRFTRTKVTAQPSSLPCSVERR